MRLIILFILTTLSLQGCIFVAGAAIGAAGVAAVYDHRKVESTIQDQKIANKVLDEIRAIPELRESTHIEVTCFNRIVLLTGQVPAVSLRNQAEEASHNVSGVNKVYNQLTIEGPTSSLTRASDSWITTKIRTEMLATKGLKSSTIKIVTENGNVYLLGIVSQNQANIAVNIARKVSGVQRVVKIFQYR